MTDYQNSYRSHTNIDKRTLAMHQLAVAKIRANPILFNRIPKTLTRWQSLVCPRSLTYLAEWQRLIDMGIDQVLRVAVEDSEYATALRQSSPFCGILTHQERTDFLRSWQWRNVPIKENHET